jgi:hypothetical protein
MSLLGKTHIFNEIANRLHGVDPSSIRLISDRVLLKDLGDLEKEGSIIIPEAYRERGLNQFGTYRKGVVISTGPGDRFLEVGIEECGNEAPRVRRKAITVPCQCQDGSRKWFDIINYIVVEIPDGGVCPACGGSGRVPVCVPPQCKPGDIVLFDRRREAEIYLNGERYCILNSEQSVIAVLED